MTQMVQKQSKLIKIQQQYTYSEAWREENEEQKPFNGMCCRHATQNSLRLRLRLRLSDQ